MGFCTRDEDGGYTYFLTHEEMRRLGIDPERPKLKDLKALSVLCEREKVEVK